MLPETHYARLGDLHLAYQVIGAGPPDILLLDQWFSHMEAQWDVPRSRSLRERLASFGRLIMFDKRGTGLSDPVPTSALPTIEEWMDDVPAVLDAVGSERAAVITNIGGGIMAMTFAAAHPERVSQPGPRRLLRAVPRSAGLPDRRAAGGRRADAREADAEMGTRRDARPVRTEPRGRRAPSPCVVTLRAPGREPGQHDRDRAADL